MTITREDIAGIKRTDLALKDDLIRGLMFVLEKSLMNMTVPELMGVDEIVIQGRTLTRIA